MSHRQLPTYPRILRAGDQAVTIEFSDTISETASNRVLALDASIQADPIAGMLETVPTYRSLTVVYDMMKVRGQSIAEELIRRALTDDQPRSFAARTVQLPVLYGGEHSGDLDEIAEQKGLPRDEVIALHLAAEYRVYMIGFAPGFAYLGGLPEILHTPRLAVPRQRIEAGAIGIGGRQSSVNSLPGPSGWRFIGRTPCKLFDPRRQDPFLLKAGDRIRFRRIDQEEAIALDRKAAEGKLAIQDGGIW